jgi:hypothetical protein
VIHFPKDQLPPSAVKVWSISPYRDNFYVSNALNRYGMAAGRDEFRENESLQ